VKTTINTINQAFENIHSLKTTAIDSSIETAINNTIAQLNNGTLRVAEKIGDEWKTHAWIKQAILLFFKLNKNEVMTGFSHFFDKVPLKYAETSPAELQSSGVRVVPPATVRYGAHIEPNTVLMPSYVNIGARIGSGCMIDTWATIGSCAQIGNKVHVSGGAGIGGVLEPLQANPTIIENNCFIGARSEIVEGVIVEENAVISMGVYIGQSTPIYDRQSNTISYGKVPAGAVVIPGNLPSKNGKYSTYAAIIVKQVDEKTRAKTSINDLLRNTI
jgi:2,3,4,5-tetrahydropyridine-2,6-dicarboxylate N-succinyltransferase